MTRRLTCAVMFAVSTLPILVAVCGRDAARAASRVALYDDLGRLHREITTTVPLAQRYFDQGLRLVYGFNHEEAVNSFQEAARLDPSCAMCYWGIALALGPNINLAMDTAQARPAWDAIQAARARAPQASERDRPFIAALATRYAERPAANRAGLDSAYARAMHDLTQRYPDDPDAAVLYADAVMNLAPWNYWTPELTPRSGTADIVATLERVQRAYPDHPGACHFYIHAVEASSAPERAVSCAERLPGLMPGAGHVVHMPAHVYMRVGRYADAVRANEHAAHADEAFFERRPANAEGFYSFYYAHNLHFLWAAAQMEGRSAEALRAAAELEKAMPLEMVRQIPFVEFVVPTRLFGLTRFSRWEEILREPAPPADLKYTRAIWHYARGRALVATGRLAEAAVERDSVVAIRQAVLGQPLGFNTGGNLLAVAVRTLDGVIAARRGDVDGATRELSGAVKIQDALVYDEPPPWYYPVRQSLGAMLLEAGRAAQAERVYREDLRRNPENGWSLYGLAEALHAQHKTGEAAAVDERFRRAWVRADVRVQRSSW
ncbi:MAG TPA: hypothetical protein VFU41_08090 [Gemmatimonadales bacterium]|nr:hypothetical protein [Gemmatimonadales bacterium]